MLDMDIINAAMVRQRSDSDAVAAQAANAAIGNLRAQPSGCVWQSPHRPTGEPRLCSNIGT